MGRLDVRVVSARDLHKAADVYVKLQLDHQHFKTSIIKSSAAPQWDEVFKFQVANTDSSQLRLELWESHMMSDRHIGSYRLNLAGLYRMEVWDQSVLLQDQPDRSGRAELRVRVCAVDFGSVRSGGAAQPAAPQPSGVYPPQPQGSEGYPPQHHHHHQQPQYPPPPPGSAYPPPQHQYPPPSAYPPPTHGQQYPPPSAYPPPQHGSAYPPPSAYPPAPGPHHHHQHQQPVPGGAGGFGYHPTGAAASNPSQQFAAMPAPLGGFAPPPNMDLTRPGVLRPPEVRQEAPMWERMGLSQIEYDHLVAVFVRFDTNDSQSLTKDELAHLLRWLNYATSDAGVNRVFDDMNKSGSDSITQDEFCSWLAYNRPDPRALYGLSQMDYDQVLMQFRTCDRSKQGVITFHEFQAFASANGWVHSDHDARRLFEQVDFKRNNRITLDEFLRWRSTNGKHMAINMSSLPTVNSGSYRAPDDGPRPSAASGVDDEQMKRFDMIEQVKAFVPQLTHEQAARLLNKYSWDAQRAIEAALEGER